MPRTNRKTQINVALSEDTFKRLHAFLKTRGLTLTFVVDRAINRHLDNPPPLVPDPLLPGPRTGDRMNPE